MSFDLEIAGLGIRVEADPEIELAPGPEHEEFRASTLTQLDLSLTFTAGGDRPWYRRGSKLFSGHKALELYERGDGEGWVATMVSGAAMRSEAQFSEDFGQAEVRLSPWPSGQTLASLGKLYEVTCTSRLARKGGGFLVHACGLALEGVGGVLLPGSSSTLR